MLKKSKKADMVLEEMGSILLSVLIILVLITATAMLIYNAFFLKEKSFSERNFESLSKRINSMEKNTETRTIIILEEDYAIIGFNKQDSFISVGNRKGYGYFRPESCKENCICLCKKNIKEGCKNADCVNFEKFKIYGTAEKAKGIGNKNLLIFGSDNSKAIISIEKTKDSIVLYKTTKNNKGSLLVKNIK